jgi:hypothetical protein
MGLLIAGLAGYGLVTYEPTPANLGVISVADMVGAPGYVVGIVIGLAMVGWAWIKAARLRAGV